ncbi:MAG TPA: class I SAM-dependent methyltransferase [Candidatus Sulfotelmatobacter sp.]|jgi:SAM-dependent methyltransferase
MPDEKTRFNPTVWTWAERAALGGLQAVLAPTGSDQGNLFVHGINSFGALQALRYFPADKLMIDFGCGNGRFARYFALRGRHVLGTEITPEMAIDAKKRCPSGSCEFVVTDGISIPVADNSIGGIWCCGVLRYSLLVENPCYVEIATEMFRVLRPGAHVVNCEMWVDIAPTRFIEGFEQAGFRTRRVLVLNRYDGRPERYLGPRYVPERWLQMSGAVVGWIRSRFDDPNRTRGGLRDYLFIWQKPADNS